MADYTTYFNGEWVPFSQVSISPNDRGFRGGDVVFDVARTFNGKSYRMKEHVERLYRSLKYARIDAGLSFEEMFDISEEAIERNEQLRAGRRRLYRHAVRDPWTGPLGPFRWTAYRLRFRRRDRLQPLRPSIRRGSPWRDLPHPQLSG